MRVTTLERPVGRPLPPAAGTPAPAPRAASVDIGRHLDGLDGLRALAIAAVVAYHLDPSWLPGGFLGVDVFLVVSGFLITTLLQREAAARGTLDLRRFWVRRARRLVPALVVCVSLSILVARLVNPDLLVNLPRQVLGALTFSTNWVEVAAGSSYFDQTSPQLFVNLWSLAVEEQFYLLWPLVVAGLVASAVVPRLRLRIALAAAAVSTALMATRFVPGADATRVYYGTDTHLMGLMIGASLAFAWASPRQGWLGTAVWLRWRRAGVAGALVALGLLMWALTDSSTLTFRGGITLASLASAVLVAGLLPRAEDRPSRWRRVMSAPVLGWVGRRSYGIYLWHWPVIVIVTEDVRTAPGGPGYLGSRVWAVLVTLALADLSYRFVEAPVRVWGFRGVARMAVRGVLSPVSRIPRVVAGTAAAMLAVTGVLVLTAPDRSATQRILEENSAYAGGSPGMTRAGGPVQGGAPVLPTPGPTAKPTMGTGPAASSAPGGAPAGTAPGTSGASGPGTGQPAVKPSTAAGAWSMPAGNEIDGFGDSMMVASVHALDYYFPGIRMDARSNRRWGDGLAAIAARGPDVRRAVVLAFGTNAGVDEPVLGQVLDRLGPDRMVVLVNIYGRASWVGDANAVLARAATGRPNVVVADWNAAIRAQPSLLQSDGIHPSITGAHLFSKTVRAALAQLSERKTGVRVELKDLPAF